MQQIWACSHAVRRAPFLSCLSSLVIDLFGCGLQAQTMAPKTPKGKSRDTTSGGAPGNRPIPSVSDAEACSFQNLQNKSMIYVLVLEAAKDERRAALLLSVSVPPSFQLWKEVRIVVWDGDCDVMGCWVVQIEVSCDVCGYCAQLDGTTVGADSVVQTELVDAITALLQEDALGLFCTAQESFALLREEGCVWPPLYYMSILTAGVRLRVAHC